MWVYVGECPASSKDFKINDVRVARARIKPQACILYITRVLKARTRLGIK